MNASDKTCPNCTRLEKHVQLLKDMVNSLVDDNNALRERIRHLEEKANQDSSNSSKPPSSDFPPKKPRTKKPKSKRKRGAQPGHANQQRKLLPRDQVDQFVSCKPKRCERCTKPLSGDDPEPRRVQHVEIPPIKPTVIEYQIHSLPCPCGHCTTGTLPDDAWPGTFGPRIQSIVALLSGAYRLSKREIERILSDVFQVDLSLGSVCNLEHATSEALEEPVEEAKQHIQDQVVAFVDETGWREDKRRAWLWCAVTTHVTVFLVRFSRGAKIAKELLGAFSGILHSDRWVGYNWYALNRRQLCWSHLKRNFQRLVDRGGPSAEIGSRLLACEKELFGYWHRVRDGTLARSTFYTYAMRIRRDVTDILMVGLLCGHLKTSKFCKELLRLENAMWTFTRVEGVEPTNNTAERAVRKPVLWRKGSFGTDSARGSRFVERILTTVASLRSQHRNVLEFLVEACTASVRGKKAPSLLPDETSTP